MAPGVYFIVLLVSDACPQDMVFHVTAATPTPETAGYTGERCKAGCVDARQQLACLLAKDRRALC